MLIAALLIGLVTAYYFGTRAGAWAAGAAVALMLAAWIPGLRLYAYLGLGLGIAALVTVAPKVKRKPSPFEVAFRMRGQVAQLKRTLSQLWSSERRD